jgi:hypothetical protein
MRTYKGYIKDDSNFKVLFENTVMLVGHMYESSYCFNKLTKEEFGIFEFDNDPTCALIGKNNDWCLIGGEILVLKTWVDNTIRVIGELNNIFALKAMGDYTVQILTDPWGKESAIWALTIDFNKLTRPTSLVKIRNFTEYADKPYVDQIEW